MSSRRWDEYCTFLQNYPNIFTPVSWVWDTLEPIMARMALDLRSHSQALLWYTDPSHLLLIDPRLYIILFTLSGPMLWLILAHNINSHSLDTNCLKTVIRKYV